MKRAYVLMSPLFIAEMCKPSEKKTISAESDIPDDASFISAEYLSSRQCFQVIFEHDSFDDIPEGNPIPQKRGPVFTKHHGKEDDSTWRHGVS